MFFYAPGLSGAFPVGKLPYGYAKHINPRQQQRISPPIIDIIEDELLTDPKVGRLLGVSPAFVCRYRLKGRGGVKLPWTWHGRNKVTTRVCIDWWQREVQRAIRHQDSESRPSRRVLDPALAAECEQAGV